MPFQPTQTPTKVRHHVAVYLLLAVGLIFGTIAVVVYLFTGK